MGGPRMEPVKPCAKWLARFVVEALGLVAEATLHRTLLENGCSEGFRQLTHFVVCAFGGLGSCVLV